MAGRKMKSNAKYIWECQNQNCRKRNIESWKYQFDVSKSHSAEVMCERCGQIHRLGFHFTIEAKRNPS